jgi:hypothetical protein
MVTSRQCLAKYGDPNLLETQNKWFVTWTVPADIQAALSHVRFSAAGTIGFPKRIFVNKDLKDKLEAALRNVITAGLAKELKTWDGCFMIRKKMTNSSMSLHSWAIAIDLNAAENGLGKTPKLSAKFVKCFTIEGLEWGGNWTSIKDGMHFQLAVL